MSLCLGLTAVSWNELCDGQDDSLGTPQTALVDAMHTLLQCCGETMARHALDLVQSEHDAFWLLARAADWGSLEHWVSEQLSF